MARWPEALRKPSNDPIIRIARWIQVMRDFAEWFLEATARVVPWLLALALGEQDAHGADWWKKYPIAPLDPEEQDE
jgi:hypothetical protein